jgi:hypothetical protein
VVKASKSGSLGLNLSSEKTLVNAETNGQGQREARVARSMAGADAPSFMHALEVTRPGVDCGGDCAFKSGN